MLTVKICGLTRASDAAAAVEAGADYLGFVFFPESRRCLDARRAGWVRRASGAAKVGVFRDQPRELIERVRDEAGLDLVQLHGGEPPGLCAALGGRGAVIKAVSVGSSVDWSRVAEYAEVALVLFDTASPTGGGTGRPFDWRLLDGRPEGLSFWLAGGLRPETVAAAAAAGPAGVDVASGVEAAVGVKDPARMRAFVAAVRSFPGRPGAAAGGGG